MKGTIIENQKDAIRNKINKLFSNPAGMNENCPIRNVLDRFGDKWSIYSILLLGKVDKIRFNELKSQINGVSQRMLTVTLRSLEQDGLVERTIFAEIPPRVEYKLTPLGRDLLVQMLALAEWAKNNMGKIENARTEFKKRNQKQLAA